MPVQKKRKHEDTKISLYPLSFEDAMKSVTAKPPPKEKKTPTKRRQRSTNKQTEQ